MRCDVQDLDLSAITVCQRAPVSIVGKHLCGGCTDLSMRANCHWLETSGNRPGLCRLCDPLCSTAAPLAQAVIDNASAESRDAAASPASASDTFIVATCCHHRMSWEVFAGQQHWLQLGFSRADFETARRLSAWHNLWGAACVAAGTSDRNGGGSASDSRATRSFEWMCSVGRAAKDVFDTCR